MANAKESPEVYTNFKFYDLADRFVFEARDGDELTSLVLDRATGTFSSIRGKNEPQGKYVVYDAQAFLGIIKLLAGYYVVLATKAPVVGSFRGSPIRQIQETKVVSCSPGMSHLSGSQVQDEKCFLDLLQLGLSSHGLFFSSKADITNTLQENIGNEEKSGLALWQKADTRFFWNRFLLEPLTSSQSLPQAEVDRWALPVLHGSFQTMTCAIKGKQVQLTLIARRSTARAGTRLWRRGVDTNGAVANFVETEQIVSVDGSVASYVQVRGSIPVMWEQIVDLKYKPKFKPIAEDGKHVSKHFGDLTTRYREVVALDLVNQKGGEGVLGGAFEEAVRNLGDERVRYEAFDFHKICGHIHFDRLSQLYDRVSDSLVKFGYFMMDASQQMLQKQRGVARTNCIDCLDRTNVTQSLLARKAVEWQLRSFKVFEQQEEITQHPAFDAQYKILWANHGDDISTQYTGTGALKGDFVRYGKRSTHGLLQDGKNAMMRYYLNNFRDGARQDAYDLIMGNYIPSITQPSPFKGSPWKRWFQRVVVSIFLLSFVMSVRTLLNVSKNGVSTEGLVWVGTSVLTYRVILSDGRSYTNRPQLCKLR